MKTDFEKFYAKVIKGLKKAGVDIQANLGRIGDIMTDFYDRRNTDMRYIIQCIKFELERGWGKEKLPGIRESAETDFITEYDKNEEVQAFVDQVLDALDKYGTSKVYDYYTNHRNEIAAFMDDDMAPEDAAAELTEYFEENGEPEYDPEAEDYHREEKEYMDDKMSHYNDAMDIKAVKELQKLHGTDDFLTHPTGADGQWATEEYPISWAISENDVATLEEYFENGIPSRLISGDEEDEEVIPWEQQYSQEFEQDYSLLTRKVAIEGESIDDAIKFMCQNVENFIVSPYDLYNLFVSSKSGDDCLHELVNNYAETMSSSDRIKPVSYFGDNISIDDICIFVEDVLM